MYADRFLTEAWANVQDVIDSVSVVHSREFTTVTFHCDRHKFPRLCDRLAQDTVVNRIWSEGWIKRVRLRLSSIFIDAAVTLVPVIIRHVTVALNKPTTSSVSFRFGVDLDISVTIREKLK